MNAIATETKPTRPALRWFGGKWKAAPWITGHFPPHCVYVEPFGGAASVLIRKPRSYAEVWNDLDGEVVNFFRVLRDDLLAARLVEQLARTPFAREEFLASYGHDGKRRRQRRHQNNGAQGAPGGGKVRRSAGAHESGDDDAPDVERARRLAVLSFMGFGSNAHARVPTGFRANSNRSGTTPAHDWMNYPEALRQVIARLRGVVIESRDAQQVMASHDGDDTLHYVDPPYVWDTRGRGNLYDVAYRGYACELSDDDHRALLAFLKTLRGGVVLSGYAHPIYDGGVLDGWARFETKALADGARERTEVLWLNPKAAARLRAPKGPLFDNAQAAIR